ncbi:uncharacterized protein LACBIDRAFT_308571 [Laccaria bicolor S238N-H82]|uniref:Predicted protein n=1 Tax=Laccaria bicolor (strain S238N-H82 / ATCC MYA-4686) TaxID=486041 RepID=B0CWP4_LACBS|nr:uncharacterized protein LACBIDRAFT_308571 [Laccaria bicolor S238N-H82]EDR13545.1 predicted protein [Laccaria bicolor S238N-H82]|eukprot:XP_001876043.1 predicted protein [Laccaria bicolor S238N-H82]
MLSEQGQITPIQDLANSGRWLAMIPGQMAPSFLVLVVVLKRNLSSILRGHGSGLAAFVSAIPQRPLYVFYDVIVKLPDMATQLLKLVAEYSLKIGGIEVEIAWTFIASLISLGPNFVPPHFCRLTRPLAECPSETAEQGLHQQ